MPFIAHTDINGSQWFTQETILRTWPRSIDDEILDAIAEQIKLCHLEMLRNNECDTVSSGWFSSIHGRPEYMYFRVRMYRDGRIVFDYSPYLYVGSIVFDITSSALLLVGEPFDWSVVRSRAWSLLVRIAEESL